MRSRVIVEVMRRLRLIPIPGATPELVGRVYEGLEQAAPGTTTAARVMDTLRDIEWAARRGDILTPEEIITAHAVSFGASVPPKLTGHRRQQPRQPKVPSGIRLDAETNPSSFATPKPDTARTAAARDARSAAKAAHVARARDLRADGMSAAQIAVRMTGERDRDRQEKDEWGGVQRRRLPAIHQRTVERWLTEEVPAD